ncbi:glycoside hydrolase family 9 protein [Cellvibrio sp.]|uniref:glycoside hydrolase family 9 protein n=1 Tax=Cellvibrio sp. TaxID=1965322 RepID=UPI0039648B1F
MLFKNKVALAAAISAITLSHMALADGLSISARDTLEQPGLTVILDHNPFSPIFFDEKNGGLQIVLHGERIATDGALRLSATPEQWDPVPTFGSRSRDASGTQVLVKSSYPEVDLSYTLAVAPEEGGFRIAVNLDKPLPKALEGKVGFNLDFLPSTYFGKTYLSDKQPGLFPRHPAGPMKTDKSGDPQPLVSGGKSITLSPEDPLTRVTIVSDKAPVALYDARNRAQNGWFVVRSMVAAGAKDEAVVWHVRPNVLPNWAREPVISYNQAGYTPNRNKVAMIELDPNFKGPDEAELLRLMPDGSKQSALRGKLTSKGKWQRYNYSAFDFSSVREPGLYVISYANQTTTPFSIAENAYSNIWQPSLDTFLPAQMDHMGVREGYRVWTAPSHLDDARQAPANLVHFDGYKMGESLDSPFKAGERIDGLSVGGWQDAGDYDIQTPDNSWVVRDLVWGKELFGLEWDETSVDEAARQVEIRKPDGQQDSLQQIRHGVRQLVAQYKIFGHAIQGIIDPTLKQYTHLGDASSQTDNKFYDPSLGENESKGDRSGKTDDRWAFTTDRPSNNLYVATALAGAARTLPALDAQLAAEALTAAKALWAREQGKNFPVAERHKGPFPARSPDAVNVQATVELLLATKGEKIYKDRLMELLPTIDVQFDWVGGAAARAIPLMDATYRKRLEEIAVKAKARIDNEIANTPFGVPISEHSWAGSIQVATFGTNMYVLHKAFPKIFGVEYTLNALDYMLGRHPVNNVSLVSTIGTRSKLVAYGHNRADYSFIAGGMVPGPLVIKPDYPELKTDWPFLWFENEYTVATTSAYILAANAASAAAKEKR